MTTLTPLRTAVGAGAAALTVAALGLGAGYTLSRGDGGGARVTTLPGAALAASTSSVPVAGSVGSGITVSATGTVSGVPDTLKLSLGVQVTADTVTAALDGANAASAKVSDALRQRGVAEKDVQTSNLSIQPQYADSGNKAQPAITGYQVTESLTATLRDLKAAGAVISAAVQAGGNATRVDGVTLDLGDTSSLVNAARAKAFAQAKDKAQQYAKAAGVSLGDVAGISEAVSTPFPAAAMGGAGYAAATSSVPISAGSQEVGVTVTVVFGLG